MAEKARSIRTPSGDVVNFLHQRGRTFKEIGKLLKVSESYISRVARGERSFTVDNLGRLACVLGKTLPELLLLATPVETVPRRLRTNYKLFLKALKSTEELKESFDSEDSKEPLAANR